ncbi:MAG: 2-polyprenyl-3-methyl-6-methoxy-1,4-benzoquinone monooxygenase [Propionivibrio sp.]
MVNIDTLIIGFDQALQTLFGSPMSARRSPSDGAEDVPLTERERTHAAALMRVNHVGEVCAQALYQGQAMASRDATIQQILKIAASEEKEHLAWTAQRIRELGGRKSLLNPLWYAGSLFLGTVAGSLGNAKNLGFLAETETQVGAHLERHLSLLPAQDAKSRSIVHQMLADELGHAQTAKQLGASDMPAPLKTGMKAVAGVMTRVAYRI